MFKRGLLLILVLAAVCFGAKEIQYPETTGQTDLYAVILRNSDLYVWDTSTNAFAASPTWTNCDIALSEHALVLGQYYANWPAALTTAGAYTIRFYKGASPANTDTFLGGYVFQWSGTAEITWANINQLADDWLDGGRLDLILDKSAKFGRY